MRSALHGRFGAGKQQGPRRGVEVGKERVKGPQVQPCACRLLPSSRHIAEVTPRSRKCAAGERRLGRRARSGVSSHPPDKQTNSNNESTRGLTCHGPSCKSKRGSCLSLFVAGFWLLFCCWLVAMSCLLLVLGCWWLVVGGLAGDSSSAPPGHKNSVVVVWIRKDLGRSEQSANSGCDWCGTVVDGHQRLVFTGWLVGPQERLARRNRRHTRRIFPEHFFRHGHDGHRSWHAKAIGQPVRQ